MGNKDNNASSFVLMALMIVLLLFVMKPGKKSGDASASKSQSQASTEQSQSMPDTISAQTVNQLQMIAATYGSEADGTFTYATEQATLIAVPADSLRPLRGTVMVENDTIDIEALISGKAKLRPEMQKRATDQLNALAHNFGSYKSFAPFFYGHEQVLTLSNGLLSIDFSTHGGIMQKAVLPKFKNEYAAQDKPDAPAPDVTLFDAATGSYAFTILTADQRISTADLYFTPTELTDSTVTMRLDLGNGAYWQIRYTLVPGQYLVRAQVEQQGVQEIVPGSVVSMPFEWRQQMCRNEVGRTFEERNSCLYYKYTESSPKHLSESKKKTQDLNTRVKWVAFKNQFFSSVVIASKPFNSAQVSSEPLKGNSNIVKTMSMQASLPYNNANGNAFELTFFLGPNNYTMLSKLDKHIDNGADKLKLNTLVPLGWGIFGWINRFIVIPVFNFLNHYISNYGIIILLLTLFIKLIIFPFTYKSYMSQAKMRVLAPEIKEINDKYPGDENAMKRQQETMALYGRVGASPFSGCLPMLLQMPVLIAMFAFFPSAIELRGQSFLWAHDLSAPDYICKLPFTIPWYGNHVSLFCLLMTATNIIYTRINMQNQAAATTGAMKWMMYLMPVMFLFFFNDYASGLSYYYFLSLLITIVQTWIFRKCINEQKVRAELLENAKKPKQPSGCMGRLSEMQKQQEAAMRQQARQNSKKRK